MILRPNLPTNIATLQALVISKDGRIERLEKLVADFKRALFGSKSEKVNSEQYELALEETMRLRSHTKTVLHQFFTKR